MPGTITDDGQPILGALDIDWSDFQFVARIHPRPDAQVAALAPEVSAGELQQLPEERDALKNALARFARNR
jgi:hypothetical protein